MENVLRILLLLLLPGVASAQLGFCTGSKGDPIFFEDFGSGTTFGPPLPAGTTGYTFIAGIPEDGQYTLYHQTGLNANWHPGPDHTPDNQPNGLNGKCLIVNASFTPGEFYRRVVTGLCANTTFEFSAWVLNAYNASAGVCGATGIPNNVRFEIWDETETVLLKQGDTGDIIGTPNVVWRQFGLTFTTGPGQTSVLLKMRNNGAGGCGNDLAIDDIMFRSCGEFVSISTSGGSGNSYTVCSDIPVVVPMQAMVSGTTPFVMQWQQSSDGLNWTDIPGQNSASYSPVMTGSQFFRIKIAQDAANMANPFCYTVSDTFSVIVYPIPNPPVTSDAVVIACSGTLPPLLVSVAPGEDVEWFDAASGGNLLATGTGFTPTAPGTYYAEAFRAGQNCRSTTRTAITLNQFPPIPVQDRTVNLCENQTVTLDATLPNVTYLWPDGSTGATLTVSSPGTYTVTLTDVNGCVAQQTYTVILKRIPVIESVSVSGTTVTINMANTGDFEYSINGQTFQSSPVFYNVAPGFGTAFVNEMNFCGNDQEDFLLLLIPAYFTPNGDGFNDVFEIPGLETMPLTGSEITIFDRYGQLITVLNQANPNWNGTLNGRLLPSTDYWFRARFPGFKTMTGHFSLKR